MRIIVHGLSNHNGRAPYLIAVALFLVAGCESPEPSRIQADCGVDVDTSVWESFVDIAGRLSAGEVVSRIEQEAFADLPGMVRWRDSYAPQVPTVTDVHLWLSAAFQADFDLPKTKSRASSRLFKDSYNYSWEHRAEVDTLLARFLAEGACRLTDKTAFWIERDSLPAGDLPVVFLPSLTDIRVYGDTLLVDTGLLRAGGLEQTVDTMAALLFRHYQAIPGGYPIRLEGNAALAHTFRLAVNEGVVGWLAGELTKEFRDDHPRLDSFMVIPEHFYETAIMGLKMADAVLADRDSRPDEFEDRVTSFVAFTIFQENVKRLGVSMASVISARFGEERLRDVSRTVPGFIAAYQEAALMNPEPRPRPGALDSELHQTMPPFGPEAFPVLMKILNDEFPPAG